MSEQNTTSDFEEAAKSLEDMKACMRNAGYLIGHTPMRRYVYGTEMVECECGVWRVSEDLPCWNHENRKQVTSEAIAQFSQSVRNLGYAIVSNIPILKRMFL